MLDMLLNLGGSLAQVLQHVGSKQFVWLISWLGAWGAGLILLPFVFDALWGVIARNLLSGFLKQNLIVESLPWRSWLKPVGFAMVLLQLIPLLAVIAFVIGLLATSPLDSRHSELDLGIRFMIYSLMLIPVGLIYIVITSLFLIRYVWRWACQELFPAAAAQGFVSADIRWEIAFIVLFLSFVMSLLVGLPTIALKILDIFYKPL